MELSLHQVKKILHWVTVWTLHEMLNYTECTLSIANFASSQIWNGWQFWTKKFPPQLVLLLNIFTKVSINFAKNGLCKCSQCYPFIFNTLLSVLVVTLLIPERYCICLNIKFPASVFRMSFSVLITFLLPLFVSFFPVDTHRRFNVDTTSYRRWNDVVSLLGWSTTSFTSVKVTLLFH